MQNKNCRLASIEICNANSKIYENIKDNIDYTIIWFNLLERNIRVHRPWVSESGQEFEYSLIFELEFVVDMIKM